ncbi:MAG: ACT domain-containing protein [Rhodospirillaceae bacterium]|nr:ACT domain-containing protein [Rhodospirillaceae bacterium]
MPDLFVVSVLCPDSPGLVAAITGRLFDLGANLGDASFAAAAGTAELRAVCEVPRAVTQARIEKELASLPELAGARFVVHPVSPPTQPGPPAPVTHRVEIAGADMPGLIARVSEAFAGYGANIVRLSSRQIREPAGIRYRLRLAVCVPPEKAEACWATVENTAAELKLACRYEACSSVEDWFGGGE